MLVAVRAAKLFLSGEDKHWVTSLLTQLTYALVSSRFRPLRAG